MPGIKIVHLSGGNAQLVPDNMHLFNPYLEGRRRYLYFAWFIDPENPSENAEIRDTVEGRGYGPHLYGYLTDHIDLYRVGRPDIPITKPRRDALARDALELTIHMVRASERDLPKGAGWAFLYALCDCTGVDVPLGFGEVFYPDAAEDPAPARTFVALAGQNPEIQTNRRDGHGTRL